MKLSALFQTMMPPPLLGILGVLRFADGLEVAGDFHGDREIPSTVRTTRGELSLLTWGFKSCQVPGTSTTRDFLPSGTNLQSLSVSIARPQPGSFLPTGSGSSEAGRLGLFIADGERTKEPPRVLGQLAVRRRNDHQGENRLAIQVHADADGAHASLFGRFASHREVAADVQARFDHFLGDHSAIPLIRQVVPRRVQLAFLLDPRRWPWAGPCGTRCRRRFRSCNRPPGPHHRRPAGPRSVDVRLSRHFDGELALPRGYWRLPCRLRTPRGMFPRRQPRSAAHERMRIKVHLSREMSC